jgi:hypothetical protein
MKLSGLTIFLIGLSVALIAISYAFFHKWQPNMTEKQSYVTLAEQLQNEINKRPMAQKRVDDAKAMVEERAAKWRETVASRTPSTSLASGGIDLSVNAWQLTVDAPKFRNSIQRAVNAQVKRGGVRVISGPEVPDPEESASSVLASYFNYPAIKFPVVIFDLGTVTVQGTYEQILTNVRSWTNMPKYLAVADGLQLSGTAPTLTGTYNLTIVGYIRGTEIFPPVPEGAAGAAPGGGGGAPPGGGGRGGGGGGRFSAPN